MKQLRAIVVDDEVENIRGLKYVLEKYCPYIDVVASATDVESGITTINNIEPDIAFLDIQLNENLSFDILDRVTFKEAKVVFVTGYDDYAIKAFQYNAIDYILKPLDIDEVVRVTNKIRDSFDGLTNLPGQIRDLRNHIREVYSQEYITIPSIKKIDVIKTRDIYYVKSESKFSVFTTEKGEIISSKNLGVYESLLPKLNFYRVHNSYIVNIDKILHIYKDEDNYCSMENGKKIPISRRRYHNFIKLFESNRFS